MTQRSVTVRLSMDPNDYVQGAQRAESATNKLGGTVGRVVGRMAIAYGAVKVGDLIANTVKLEATYSRTMAQVAAQTGAPQREMDKLDKLALKLGQDTVYSAQDAGNAMLELAKGGLTPAQIQAGALQQSLTLAAAGGLELGDAADAVVNSMGAFHLSAGQASVAVNALAGGANASSADVSDMTQALAQAGQQAESTGLSISDTTGYLAAFANNGIKGSDAGTSLKTMLQNLQPQTKRQADEMAKLHLSFVDANGQFVSATQIAGRLHDSLQGLTQAQRAAALQTIFGTDASRAANILANEGAAGIAKYIKASQDQTSAQKLAQASMSGTSGALQQLSGAVETAEIEFGKGLAPVVQEVGNGLAAFIGDHDLESWGKNAGEGVVSLAHELTPLATDLVHIGQDVLPGFVHTGAQLVTMLKEVLDIAQPVVSEFSKLPAPVQQAILMGGAAFTLSKRLQNASGQAGPVQKLATSILGMGTSSKKADPEVKGFAGAVASLSSNLKVYGALAAASYAVPKILDSVDTDQRALKDLSTSADDFAASFSLSGESTKATAKLIEASFANNNVGKYADELHINQQKLATDFAKYGENGKYVQQVIDDLQGQQSKWKGALNDVTLGLVPVGGRDKDIQNFIDSLDSMGTAFDNVHAKAQAMGEDMRGLLINQLVALGKISIQTGDDLKKLPAKVQTAVLTPGATDSISKVEALAKKFKLTPSEVRTVMQASGFTTKDIDKVIAQLKKLGVMKTKPKVDVDTAAAEAGIQFIQDKILHIKGNTVRINLITNKSTVTSPGGATATEQANGSVLRFYASGGVESHVAQMAPAGAMRVWAEPETQGESYIPHAASKRSRSLAIWGATGKILGVPGFADGGVVVGSSAAGGQGFAALIKALDKLTVTTTSAAQARFDKYQDLAGSKASALDIVNQRVQISDLDSQLDARIKHGKNKGKYELTGLAREQAKLELADAEKQLKTMKATNAELAKYGSLKAEQARLDIANAASDLTSSFSLDGVTSAAGLERNLLQMVANSGQFTQVLSKLKAKGAAPWLLQQLESLGPTKTAIRIANQLLSNSTLLASTNSAANALQSVAGIYGTVTTGGTLTSSQKTILVQVSALDNATISAEITRQVKHALATEASGGGL